MTNPIPADLVGIMAFLAAIRWMIAYYQKRESRHLATMAIRLWGFLLYFFVGTDAFSIEISQWTFLARMWILIWLIDENLQWIIPGIRIWLLPKIRARLLFHHW